MNIKLTGNTEQEAFQQTTKCKEIAKSRYKMKVKNSVLKQGHGYDTASTAWSIWHRNTRCQSDVCGQSQANTHIMKRKRIK